MKSNAIARIILHTVLALILISILVSALFVDGFLIRTDRRGTIIEEEALFDTTKIKNIQIDWAAGSVTIRAADINQITVCEVAPDGCKYQMTYEINGDTLELNYGNGTIIAGFGTNIPSKDLIVTVPRDWVCDSLAIDGASLDIDLQDLTIGKMELDGASCNLNFSGGLEQMDTDGAATKITLVCTNRISTIDVDGASCELDLTLPEGCGFLLEMDGISCDLHTDLQGTSTNDQTVYGDGHCKIYVDGISCDVTIRKAETESNTYNVICANDFTEEMLLEPLAAQYTPGTIVKLKTDILMDVDLELYVDGQFICKQTEAFASDGSNYWEFYFTMPYHDVIIQMKTSGGLLP